MLLLLFAWTALPPPSWAALIRYASVTDGGTIGVADQRIHRFGIDGPAHRLPSESSIEAVAATRDRAVSEPVGG